MSIYIILFLAVIIIVFVICRPVIRGQAGEANVAARLKSLPKSEYTVFNDLLIQRGEYSSQIDHVVVSKYGVFVIETKNYKGWIYGGEYSEYWIQNIWGNKYELYNPILQNQGHVKALKAYLGVRNFPFIPVVAFSSRGTVKVNTKENFVVYFSEITRFIKTQKIVLLSDEDIRTVVDKLQKLPKYKRKDKRKHIEQVKWMEFKNERTISNGRCPRCGGTLVPRTGRYGNFYGCSNYPKCKFTCQ